MSTRPASPVRAFTLPLSLGVALALGACTQTQQGVAGDTGAHIPPAGRVVGEPVNCIQTSRIRNTVVHNDDTIDFVMAGGPTYRNTLPHRCTSLGFEERFGYQTSTGQLCSTDIIYVLYSNGQRGAGCGLGQFLPIEMPQTAN